MCSKGGVNLITVKRGNEEIPINHIKSANRRFYMNDIPEMNLIVARHKDNPAYAFLNEEEVIVTPDGHEWRIKVESEVTHYKNLNTQHILRDLTDLPLNQLLNGTQTARDLLSTILQGTGFTLDLNITGLSSITVSDFGRKNRWQLLKDACDLLNAEFTVLPGRIIRVRKALSNDKGKQYRYGYNLKNVTKKTDSTDIVTHVTVNYGEDNSLSETFVSPNAGNYSRAYYGDIISDDRITERATAQRRAEAEFKDIDISYELDIAQIGNDVELGETIHTIYEPLNDLSITTRILKTRDDWNGDEFILTEATVGNYVFKTANQILQGQINDNKNEIDDTKENLVAAKKEYRSKIEQTDDRITLEVEKIDDSIAAINIRADNIQLSVTDLANQTSSSINLLRDQIELKVSADGVISAINMTPETVSISANKINLNGAVMVNGSITGATSIDVSTNINLGQRIRFNDFTSISSSGGSIQIEAFNYLFYVGLQHFFYGTVDFSAANLIGLPPPTIIYVPTEPTGG